MGRSSRDYNQEAQRDATPRSPIPDRCAEDLPLSQGSRSGGDGSHSNQERPSDSHPTRPIGRRRDRIHCPELGRDRTYNLRDSETRVLAEIGTFRAVTVQDLSRLRYGRDGDQARRELDNLARQGLIQLRTTDPNGPTHATLTRDGRRFIESHRPPDMSLRQVLYEGFVKPREAKHDAALYRLYWQEAGRIAGEGGKVKRVVLDFELKQSINRKLSRIASVHEPEKAARMAEIAQEHGLVVVDGKIPIPDLRLEYEDQNHEQAKVDLELATAHYHRDTLAEKARAGFAIFRETSQRGRTAEHDYGIMREILSL